MQKVVYAKLNNSLISARKVRLVADLVRGKTPQQAEAILQFTDKTAAKDLLKKFDELTENSLAQASETNDGKNDTDKASGRHKKKGFFKD